MCFRGFQLWRRISRIIPIINFIKINSFYDIIILLKFKIGCGLMQVDTPKDITVFIDESGTIAKGNLEKDDYFIITLLFVENSNIDYVKKIYRKNRLKVVKKKQELYEYLKNNKEVKGSQLSENNKFPIYENLITKCDDKFELGLIVLNNKCATEKFRSNSSRVFNFLIKTYLESYFKKYSTYKNLNSLNFIIDERNVVTESTYTLQEYLNTELNLVNNFSNKDITVHYHDSRNFLLLQMADFISNTFFRKYHKKNSCSNSNVELLLKFTCENKIFKYPL